MDRICEKLNSPRAFFLRPISDRGERAILYRSLAAATKSARERAEVRFEWLREITEYLHGHFEFPKLNLPSMDLPVDFRTLTHDAIERAAMQCRQLWGFGEGPIGDVVLALESNGIIVARGELGSEALDAFSEYLPNDFPYIFLGTDKHVAARSRFDAAHELGHLILHRHLRQRDFGHPKDFKTLESQAHRFAAAFLLPGNAFLKSIWAPTLDAFRGQKETWKVSIKGMIVRTHQLGVIDENKYARLMINYGRRYREGEPGDDVLKMEQPRFLARCFEMLLAERICTKEQLLINLPLQPHDIEELASLPRGFFSGFKGEVIELPVLRKVPRESASEDGQTAEIISLPPFKVAS
jgi:Zn-dependent peptidase ImmA (M78 family)